MFKEDLDNTCTFFRAEGNKIANVKSVQLIQVACRSSRIMLPILVGVT